MRKRLACFFLAVLMLCSLAPAPARADGSVYFTAVNDTLLDLNDATMPFWSDGVLYVSPAVVDGTDLNVKYAYSRDRQTVVLYRQRTVLVFDLAANTATDSSGRSYNKTVTFRGGSVYLPLEVLCRCFEAEYSIKKVEHGYLLRVKNASAVLSDAQFIDAAGARMETSYARYVRAHTPESDPAPEPVAPEPATPTPPAPTPSAPTPEPEPEPEPERTVRLAVEVTDGAAAAQLLAAAESLGPGAVTFLFTEQTARAEGDLLRRLAAESQSTALRVDASNGGEAALEAIAQANAALWEACNRKTRLVLLDGADEAAFALVRAAGYCPVVPAADLSASLPTTAVRLSAAIFAAADARGGSCTVLLGADSAVVGTFYTLLYRLRQGNCTVQHLTELTV